MTDLDFLQLSKPKKLLYKLRKFIVNLPKAFLNALKGLLMWFVNLFKGVGNELYDIFVKYRSKRR